MTDQMVSGSPHVPEQRASRGLPTQSMPTPVPPSASTDAHEAAPAVAVAIAPVEAPAADEPGEVIEPLAPRHTPQPPPRAVRSASAPGWSPTAWKRGRRP